MVTGCTQKALADPTGDLSFNLNLTPEQQHLRAKVPLPYAHNRTSPKLISVIVR